MKYDIRRILNEEGERVSNYQRIIDNFKSTLPPQYDETIDEVFEEIRSFIERKGFTIKVLNYCTVPFRGVRTRDFIIICSPHTYKSLAELVYILFHEIRHEIQMGELEMENPLSGDFDDFEELYRRYWDMEIDAHNYGLEWVDRIGNIINLPDEYYKLSPTVTNYPTMGHMVRNQIQGVYNQINRLREEGYEYNDIVDLPMISNLIDRLEDIF
jgi:hypothetical protein